MPSPEYDSLIYIEPNFHPRDIVDKGLESVLSKLALVETGGSEINIPEEGSLVIGFIPHSGFLEPVLTDQLLIRSGRGPSVWVSKKENQEIPEIFQSSRRFIFINRQNPEKSSIKAIGQVLQTPEGTIGSALEGTRFSNPVDPNDTLTLGESKTGLMRFSYEANVPLLGVVVLGVENILPSLDKIVKEKGMIKALELVAKGLINPVEVQMRFLPIYKDHLGEDKLKGVTLKEHINRHNLIFTTQLIDVIKKLRPDYPLGVYGK